MTPFVLSAINFLEDVQYDFYDSEEDKALSSFANLVAKSDSSSSRLPYVLIEKFLERQTTRWPDDYTKAAAVMVRRDPLLLDIVKDKLLSHDESVYQTIAYLLPFVKDEAVSLIDLLKIYGNGGEGQRLFASIVAMSSHYSEKAEEYTRAMFLSCDENLRFVAI